MSDRIKYALLLPYRITEYNNVLWEFYLVLMFVFLSKCWVDWWSHISTQAQSMFTPNPLLL